MLTATTSNSRPASKFRRRARRPARSAPACTASGTRSTRARAPPAACRSTRRASPARPVSSTNGRSSGTCWSSCWSMPILLEDAGLGRGRIAGLDQRARRLGVRGRARPSTASAARDAVRALPGHASNLNITVNRLTCACRARAAGAAAGAGGAGAAGASVRVTFARRRLARRRRVACRGARRSAARAGRQAALEQQLLRLVDRDARDARLLVDPAVAVRASLLLGRGLPQVLGSTVISCGSGALPKNGEAPSSAAWPSPASRAATASGRWPRPACSRT